MDQDVSTGLEGATSLIRSLGMHANRTAMLVRGTDHCVQCRVVEQRPASVQHQFDQVMPVVDGIIYRAYAVCRSRQFTHRARRSPNPIGGVPTYCGQERSSNPNEATSRRITLPAACDTRYPAQIVYLNDGGVCQSGGIDEPEVDMPVDKT